MPRSPSIVQGEREAPQHNPLAVAFTGYARIMPSTSPTDESLHATAIPPRGGILIGRKGGLVDLAINHPSVSLRHAKVFRRGEATFVLDLRSANGTYVDGKRIWREAALLPGARLAVGPVQFDYDGTRLMPAGERQRLAITCEKLRRVVDDPSGGRRLTILDGISLAILPAELVCLIGPSGSGKTTLLSILSGRQRPNGGRVMLRDRNLHAEFESLKHDLAVVPQKESLHGPLTVRQALMFSAALRLPLDTTRRELDLIVTSLIREAGLEHRQGARIRDLSGGQLKRVSLANEIGHRPSVIFLDEVTSGLDELGDLEIMSLARTLADKGRSVVCITHNTLNIERTAHRVVVLTGDGRLACVGTPGEVRNYFTVPRLGDVYGAMAMHPDMDWHDRFRHHPLWQRHVGQWLAKTDTRDRSIHGSRPKPVATKTLAPHSSHWLRVASQVVTLIRRLICIQTMDPRPTMMAVVQAVFVASLLVLFFGNLELEQNLIIRATACRNAAFLLVISAFWLGCNNAAPEISRERQLFEQERAVSVKVLPYYCSKVVVLGTITIVQSLILFELLSFFSHLPGDGGWTGAVERLIITAGTGLLGVMTGLAISAVSRSEQVAVRAVPLLMIPQIVLADVLAPLTGWLAWTGPAVASTYWTFRAFTAGTVAYRLPEAEDVLMAPALAAILMHAIISCGIALAGLSRRTT